MAHKSFELKELKNIVSKYSAISTLATDSGVAFITDYGARVLGLFPAMDMPNCLWIPERIDSLMCEENWLVGGERLWISPERNFYYENPRDFEGHKVPAGMDPGEFKKTDNLTFRTQYPLFDFIRNKTYDECYSQRSFKLKTDPFNSGLAFVGVEISDEMGLSEPNIDFCCWTLSMIYTCGAEQPGTALYPINEGGAILSYFDPIPQEQAEIIGDYARFKIDANGIYKFSLKPEDMVFDNKTKAVYVSPYPDSDQWFCVIKRSDDMPRTQNECVDPAKGNPDGPRGAIQSYNNGPGFADELLPFGEIELQLAKGISQDEQTISKGSHELLCYAGTKNNILSIAQQALQNKSEIQLY